MWERRHPDVPFDSWIRHFWGTLAEYSRLRDRCRVRGMSPTETVDYLYEHACTGRFLFYKWWMQMCGHYDHIGWVCKDCGVRIVEPNARLPFRPYSHLEEGEKEHVRTCRIELFPDGARCGEYLRGEPLLDFK